MHNALHSQEPQSQLTPLLWSQKEPEIKTLQREKFTTKYISVRKPYSEWPERKIPVQNMHHMAELWYIVGAIVGNDHLIKVNYQFIKNLSEIIIAKIPHYLIDFNNSCPSSEMKSTDFIFFSSSSSLCSVQLPYFTL